MGHGKYTINSLNLENRVTVISSNSESIHASKVFMISILL